MTAGGTAARIYATAARLRGQRIADDARATPDVDSTVWSLIDLLHEHVAASGEASSKFGAFAHADAAHAAADAAQVVVAYHRHGEPADHLHARLMQLVDVAHRASDDAHAVEPIRAA